MTDSRTVDREISSKRPEGFLTGKDGLEPAAKVEAASAQTMPPNRFRTRRFRLFRQLVSETLAKRQRCSILDIGGTVSYWSTYGPELDPETVDITVVNIDADEGHFHGIKVIAADACDLKRFNDFSFDIVHSNSVIEHVGRWRNMERMASEVRRLAPKYFVQTPYFWFPIEPHARFPALHWMPEAWRYRILMNRSCGYWQQQKDLGGAMEAVQSAVLLDRRQMQYLFPDSAIVAERVFGLTKSLIAIH
jgi:Methyltransferase domain